MNELPLSKFAPFTKDECRFTPEVTNKLKDIGVKCEQCIYLGKKLPRPSPDQYDYPYGYIYGIKEDDQLYSCNILSEKESVVGACSLCRFFTNKEEGKDQEEEDKPQETTTEDLSKQIQKLDFSNGDISTSINQLREKLINEQ